MAPLDGTRHTRTYVCPQRLGRLTHVSACSGTIIWSCIGYEYLRLGPAVPAISGWVDNHTVKKASSSAATRRPLRRLNLLRPAAPTPSRNYTPPTKSVARALRQSGRRAGPPGLGPPRVAP